LPEASNAPSVKQQQQQLPTNQEPLRSPQPHFCSIFQLYIHKIIQENEMASSHPQIAIIGGGLSGLCLALHLSKRNIKCTIYERRPATYDGEGYIVLYPNASRVLDHIGLYETLKKEGYNSKSMTMMNRSGIVLGTMAHGGVFGYPNVRLSRRTVKKVLENEVGRNEITMVFGKQLKSVDEGEEKVNLYFEDGATATADMVIGSDGLRSVVRNYLHPNVNPDYIGTMVIYGCISASDLKAKMGGNDERLLEPNLLFGKEGSFTVWPRDPAAQQVAFFASFSLPDRSREEWKKFEEDKDGIRKKLEENFCQDGWPEQVQVICQNCAAVDFKTWPITMLPPLSTWRSPSNKVILIGDAAHAIPPSAGQGGSTAIEDAETLAIAISKIADDPNALQKWEDHRKQRVKQVIGFTNQAVKLRETSGYRAIEYIKEWVIWALLKARGPEGNKWLYGYDGEVEMAKL
jgi:2-polyprenyl-6-methoxyphenol hydroxylase-like FAD-dependent oxidoreductase